MCTRASHGGLLPDISTALAPQVKASYDEAMRSILLLSLAACASHHGGTGDVDAAMGDRDSSVRDGTAVDGPPLPSGPVNIVITADNAYSFGYGDVDSIQHFTQGTKSDGSAIFDCPLGTGPEAYVVPEADAPPSAFLYIVAWDDLSVTQGVIADITRQNATVVTGDSPFEVCATGIAYSSGPSSINGPPLDVINQEITRCNAGTGAPTTTSQGWVNTMGPTSTPGATGLMAVGETNDDAGGTFPIVCQPTATALGVRSTARWLWYDPNDGQAIDPFHATGMNRFKSFLIFRLGVSAIIF
ncbi:hypothetical protein BH11MYX1_BH11MYX1_28530 [soil metagenome]